MSYAIIRNAKYKRENLKGQIKTVSNIICEYIITSDKVFFDTIGKEETKRYFETAYKFVCEYKDLGEQYILSAKVHMDEETPHMHLVFIPVVHITDKKEMILIKLLVVDFGKLKIFIDNCKMLSTLILLQMDLI